MSLINEALKKAQRQRSLDNAPLSAAPSGVAAAAVTTHVRSASHKRSHGALWFGLGLVALGAAATVLVMRYDFDAAEPAKTTALAPVAPPPPPASPPTPASASAVQPAPRSPAENTPPMVVLPPITQSAPAAAPSRNAPPSPAPAPVTSQQPSAPVVATVVPAAAPVPALSPAPEATSPVSTVAAVLTPAEREAQVYSFLNTVRLTGVRGLDREARVLMNERLWRLNDVVSPELGLRLSAVRPNLLVFTDAQGRTYEKPY